jgi:hypothetical protein
MDFVEKLFGVSPDGGSGAFGLVLFLFPITGLSLLYVLRGRVPSWRSSMGDAAQKGRNTGI